MSKTALLVAWRDDLLESDEFRALQAGVRSRVESVWQQVRSVESVAAVAPGWSLLVVSARCYLGTATLEAMRHELEAGARAVTALRLARTGLPELDEIHTPSGIEAVEARVLEGRMPAFDSETPPYAALLLSPEMVKQFGLRGADEILGDQNLVSTVVTVGLCHEFVDYYGEVRKDLLPFLDSSHHDILEIGCGRGRTGAFLQERLNCRVTGVELNPVVARDAMNRLHRVLVGDILEIDPGGPYDAVVACEVFEHLTHQDVFLQKLRTWLRPGGRAVLTVPNVGHYSIVEDLLAGRWDYLPMGLLCETHYRFFTRRTLEDVLAAAGFRDVEFVAQRTREAPWLDAVASVLNVDRESLSTLRYYVVISMPQAP